MSFEVCAAPPIDCNTPSRSFCFLPQVSECKGDKLYEGVGRTENRERVRYGLKVQRSIGIAVYRIVPPACLRIV